MENILGAAACLQSSGLEKGDCILLSALKDVEFVYLYFAAHLLGLVNVIVDPTSNEERKNISLKRFVRKESLVLREVLGILRFLWWENQPTSDCFLLKI